MPPRAAGVDSCPPGQSCPSFVFPNALASAIPWTISRIATETRTFADRRAAATATARTAITTWVSVVRPTFRSCVRVHIAEAISLPHGAVKGSLIAFETGASMVRSQRFAASIASDSRLRMRLAHDLPVSAFLGGRSVWKGFAKARDTSVVEPTFAASLQACLAGIPRGRAVPCAAIARALGDGRATRAVASWIRDHPDVAGAHRVVRADRTPLLPDAGARLVADGNGLEAGRFPASRIARPPRTVPLLARLRAEQEALATRVSERDGFRAARLVAGADVGYDGDRAYAAVAVWDVLRREPIEIAEVVTDVDFPYIPTYLALREFPPIRAAYGRLRAAPDVLLVDGHGRLHPALFGFACYAGIQLGLPTIGVAKHPLVGSPIRARRRGDDVPIVYAGKTRGIAWTPPGASRPVYISVGHRVSLKTAMRIVRDVTIERMPEPLRLADAFTKKRKRAIKGDTGSGS